MRKPSREVSTNGLRSAVGGREPGAVHDEIEAAELAIERRRQIRDLLVAGDVARGDDRVVAELGRQFADVFLEPLARIRERDPGARGLRGLAR